MGQLLTETAVPHKALFIAGHRQRIAEQTVVRLVFRAHIGLHGTLGRRWGTVQDDHAGHGVRAVHQRGGSLQNLYRVHGSAVYLYAVLVAPLLTFLAHTFAHHHHAVVSQSADDGLRDGTTRRQLGNTRQFGYGVNDVCRCRRTQFLRTDNADGCRGILQLRVASDTRYHQLVQLQVTEEYIRRVLLVVMMFYIILSCHCGAYTQQWQNDVFCFHSVFFLFTFNF